MKSLFSRFAKTLISLQKSARTLKFDAIEGSPVYLRSMLRRPPAVLPWKLPGNSRSFIGTVIRPVKGDGFNNPIERAYTLLEVKTPSRDSDLPPPPFKILLDMRDKLPEISMRHLKLDDYVYVIVTELNFVKQKDTNQTSLKPKDPVADLTMSTSYMQEVSSDNEKEKRDRLRLWQVFFASTHEWWDNRQNKLNPLMPDFKRKDTQECLWLRPDDPPWVRKQLQHYDSSTRGA